VHAPRERWRRGSGRWPSTHAIPNAAATSLVDCFLFSGAPAFQAPIEGTTTFAAEFSKQGLTDGQGRSLRSFGLQDRLFGTRAVF
jgi:hypothetical protein